MDEKIVKDSQGLAKDLVNDCISRYGVAAWLDNMGYTKLAYAVMDKDRFPPAQPEKRTDKHTKMHACDLIDRQAAIDELEHKKDKNAKGDISGFYNKIIQNDIDALMQLPSVQSESKKGKWIEAYDPFNRISGRCSVCGWEAHLYEDDVVGMNYCPNCGADMRGEQDDSI